MAGPFGETINVDIGDPVCVSCLTTWGYAKPPRIGDSSGTYGAEGEGHALREEAAACLIRSI